MAGGAQKPPEGLTAPKPMWATPSSGTFVALGHSGSRVQGLEEQTQQLLWRNICSDAGV